MPETRTAAQIVSDRLSIYLGPHTATNAVKTFATQKLHLTPESLTRADAPRLVDALRPMLRTLLGATQTDQIIELLKQDLSK